MTRSQKAALELSEKRSALMTALEGGQEETIDAAAAEVRTAEASYRAALSVDSADSALAPETPA